MQSIIFSMVGSALWVEIMHLIKKVLLKSIKRES